MTGSITSGIFARVSPRNVATISTIFGRKEQSRLDRRDRKMCEQELDLLPQVARIDRLDARDFSRHFGDHTSDRGEPINAERAEGFQVGLQARASAAIGAGDREGDREGFCARRVAIVDLASKHAASR